MVTERKKKTVLPQRYEDEIIIEGSPGVVKKNNKKNSRTNPSTSTSTSSSSSSSSSCSSSGRQAPTLPHHHPSSHLTESPHHRPSRLTESPHHPSDRLTAPSPPSPPPVDSKAMAVPRVGNQCRNSDEQAAGVKGISGTAAAKMSPLKERLAAIEEIAATIQNWQQAEKVEYERCVTDLASQVSRAVALQQLMKSEVEKLQQRVVDLENHNKAMTTMIIPTLVSSVPFLFVRLTHKCALQAGKTNICLSSKSS